MGSGASSTSKVVCENVNNNDKDMCRSQNEKRSTIQNSNKFSIRNRKSKLSSFSITVDSDDGDNIIEDKFILTTRNEVQYICNQLTRNKLYCDPHFPANDRVLFFNGYHNDRVIKWIRPQDLVLDGTEPEMMIDGVTRDDIQQGILGDCWFLSSCAAVSQQQRFMKTILPKDQPLCGQGYKGVVCFRFWRFGDWVEVYIDDRLPTVNRKLIYAHCTEANEFWVALIEKAYAKLRGCYQSLEGGQTMDALVDLTGGLAERYMLEEYDPNMYRLILRAHKNGAFITCSRKGDWNDSTKSDATGLVSGHAYTITCVIKIKHQMGEEKLLRIRNPWGDATEWKGSWSDNDVNWKWVDSETKQMMDIQSKDDGEFWMSFKDFYRHFQEVTICLTGPDFDGDGVSDAVGHMEMISGQWKGKSAGGSRNNLDLFTNNPQYLLTLTEPDDFNLQTDDPELEGMCSVVIALMQEQKPTREADQNSHQQIAFVIYEIDNPNERLTKRYFHSHHERGRSGLYINYREVSGRFELSPGHYVIIPSMFQPHIEGRFLIRVFGEKKFSLTRLL
ncbi:hypothetical protein SNE40_001878 [Patella caerulea]|uniref:Calpain catalytic domain-containing protein n=2 Tax=Patella caerulea TaxID=87958 RepID=A0AAN8K037_PATCE